MGRLRRVLISVSISIILSLTFYMSIYPALIISPVVYFLLPNKSHFRKNDLYAFRNMLNILYSEIIAGKSFRNSTKVAISDTKFMDTLFRESVEMMELELNLGMSDLEVWKNFEERLKLDSLTQFILIIDKGYYTGDLLTIIRRSIQLLSDRLEIEIEINLAIAAKKFEFNTMMISPVVLLAFLTLSNRTYMSMLFETSIGRLVMSFGLISLIIAYKIGDKIIKIEV